MTLRRAGLTLFGSGLLVASVAAVLFGEGRCTPAVCPNGGNEFVFRGITELGRIIYYNGCTACSLSPALTLGLLAMVAGVVAGGIGLLRSTD